MSDRLLVEIHTADIHFGAMDPKVQYEILMEEMIKEKKLLRIGATRSGHWEVL